MIREKLSVQNAEPETGQKVPSKYRTEITAFLFLFPSLIGFCRVFYHPRRERSVPEPYGLGSIRQGHLHRT